MHRVEITEYLSINLESEKWMCNRCEKELVSARQAYYYGCLVHERPTTEVYGRAIELPNEQAVNYAPDSKFTRMLEFYCPHCGTMLEVQYLPPGHPILVDISLDIDALKEKQLKVK